MLLELVFLRLFVYLLVCMCVHFCGMVYVCVCVGGERVKPIDYFNPSIRESVILSGLSAQPSTGGLLMWLNASLLRLSLPVQST